MMLGLPGRLPQTILCTLKAHARGSIDCSRIGGTEHLAFVFEIMVQVPLQLDVTLKATDEHIWTAEGSLHSSIACPS